METKILSTVLSVVLLAAIGLVGGAALTSADEAVAGKASRKLEGTWMMQVTIHDCATGAEIRSFPALLTFAQGGTFTETTAGFPPAARTPGHGFWKFTAAGAFDASSTAFLFSPTGQFTGTQTLTQSIEFTADPDEISSTASISIVDPSGNTVMTGCATAVGHRVQ